MIVTTAPALKVLLHDLIDYAGLFPPAKCPLDKALAGYDSYENAEHSWMLRWFVVSQDKLQSVPSKYDGKLSVLTQEGEPRAAAIESKGIVKSDKPVYWEVPTDKLDELTRVKEASNFAKIRMGGVTADAFPTPKDVAAFIRECARLKLPFKATAGLHHPLRGDYKLTYEDKAPKATMHGFINVLMAAAFAWNEIAQVEEVLSEVDPHAFSFGETASWKEFSITKEQIKDTRENFFHSIGSCSFEEPVQDLKKLNWL